MCIILCTKYTQMCYIYIICVYLLISLFMVQIHLLLYYVSNKFIYSWYLWIYLSKILYIYLFAYSDLCIKGLRLTEGYLSIHLVGIYIYVFILHSFISSCVCVFSLYAFMFTFCTKSFLIPCIYIRIYAWLHDFVMSGYVWPLPFWLCHFQWWWRPKHQVLGFWSWTPATMLGRRWWIGLVGAVSIGLNHGLSIGHLWISQAFFWSVFSPVKMSRQETSLVAVQCSPRMAFSCWIEDMARLNIQAPTLHWKVDDLGMAENTASNNE